MGSEFYPIETAAAMSLRDEIIRSKQEAQGFVKGLQREIASGELSEDRETDLMILAVRDQLRLQMYEQMIDSLREQIEAQEFDY